MGGLMREGLQLLLFGMGMVFLFLTLLIFSLHVMSRLVARFAPAVASESASPPHKVSASGVEDPRVIAVIGAAIARYRAAHRR